MFTLVVMAAGVGSRYGGVKQMAPVGPDGEAFLDFAIADAVEAGATKVVIVVRTQIEHAVRRHVDARHGMLPAAGVEVVYVRQDEHGPRRPKPWGTAHAAVAAASEVPGPFIICNADDYYGSSTFAILADSMAGVSGARLDGGEAAEAVLCGYRLGSTLPDSGAVSRGVCEVSDGRLLGIVEHHGVTRLPDGVIVAADPRAVLHADTVVSMNLWAFPPVLLDWVSDGFDGFLADHADDPDAEYILPDVVASKMAEGSLVVRVVTTDDHWTGITHPQDLSGARSMLSRLSGDLRG